jgi:hypothetical protein
MADKNPFANAGLSQFGAESGDAGGLGPIALAYLAHKSGLIDLSNKDQINSIKQNGVLGHMAMGAVKSAIAPKGPGYGPLINPTGVSNDNNADIGGGFNPAGIPPTQTSYVVTPPGNDVSGMDSKVNGFVEPKTDFAMHDHELIDDGIANFASLLI